MAWSFVGISASVESLTTAITLAEPAGVADGDLLVACFASRSTATTAITNTGWTAVNSQNNNNALTTTSALASGTMLYQVRVGAPDLSFVIPAGISVCLGRIVAYRGNATTTPLDASTAVTTAINTLSVSVAGLTTTQADDLIVAMTAGGQEAAWSAFNNVTTPIGSSGTGSSVTAAPSASLWQERADVQTTGGNDTSLAIFDAIRTGIGATGNLTATASLGAGHVVIAGAFKIAPPPGLADAWNSADKTADVTLSNNDKTATAGSGGARSTQRRTPGTAGKYYAEFRPTVVFASVPNGGLKLSTASLTTTASAVYVLRASGNIGVSGAVVGNAGASSVAVNDIICMAVDMGARLIWFRINTSNWNNSGAANPATGTGGIDISSLSAGDYALWFQGNVSGASLDVRTEAADYTQMPPSGFLSWMGETLTVAIPGVKVWSGSAWVEKPAKVWTGSAWTQKPVKVWNGSAWT